MNRLTRDGTAEPVSRDQILRRVRRQGNIHFTCCPDDHEQDWQPYPVDPYSAIYMCDDHTYILHRTKFSGTNERGQGNIHFSCSADHVQDWQNLTWLIHTTLAICVTIHTHIYTYIHTYIHTYIQ